jgi:histidinol-phosphate/aromatic aminotransferase/cobyric acid decarboxylase-like protein
MSVVHQNRGCLPLNSKRLRKEGLEHSDSTTLIDKARCFHGGSFFDVAGTEFGDWEESQSIICADTLDAWFPPAPEVIEALRDNLSWILKTSPPIYCEGMVKKIAEVRDVDPVCILAGAGSSNLIYLAFTRWLNASSRALVLDPTYGEYEHVLQKVIGCRVDRLILSREENYDLDTMRLLTYFKNGYDLIVLVNPNSPTGRFIPRQELEAVLSVLPLTTRVWIDEAYVDYAGSDASLERFAATRANVVVAKSMSKVYALSGARAAYLCASSRIIEDFKATIPPWAVSLPAQIAATKALECPDYYSQRYAQTHLLRTTLIEQLIAQTDFAVIPGTANYILAHLPDSGPDAATLVEQCRSRGLLIRDASSMGSEIGSRAVRITVEDAATNRAIVEILTEALYQMGQSRARDHSE